MMKMEMDVIRFSFIGPVGMFDWSLRREEEDECVAAAAKPTQPEYTR